MATVDISGQFLPFNIKNSSVPPEGPKAIRIPLDFTLNGSLMVDMTMVTQGQPAAAMSYVQTLFVDNSGNASALTIQTDALQQSLKVPAYSQGYLPVLQPNNPKLIFTSTPAAGNICQVFALNFPVSPAVWGVQSAFSFNGQSLKVTDVLLDALISNYGSYGNALAVADLGLQSLISGGALKVTGSSGGSLSPALLSFTGNWGIGAILFVAGTASKSIVLNSIDVSIAPNTWSNGTAGDRICIPFRNGNAGAVFLNVYGNVPSAAPTAFPVGNQGINVTGINFELGVAQDLRANSFAMLGSTITFPNPNPGITITGTYQLV